jgi:hypothetical protein
LIDKNSWQLIFDGYEMQTGDKVKLGRMRHLFNPYISLIESVSDDFETVWFRGHNYWKFEDKITRVKGKPSWLTVIHQENKSNWFRGFGKVRQEFLDDFNIKKEKLVELKARFFIRTTGLFKASKTDGIVLLLLTEKKYIRK